MDEHPPTSPLPSQGLGRVGADYSGSTGDQQILNARLAQRTGESADTYGSLGSLMYGPLVRESAGGAR
jgi:phospholipid/cholesterol/gamma-HCH transport system substrate-binding protein